MTSARLLRRGPARLRSPGSLLALVLWLLLLSAGAARAELVKFALIIGNNRGQDPARSLRFAEHDARKVLAVLGELGELRPENTRLLLGRSAAEVWTAWRGLEERIRRARRDPGTRTMLIVYYSGHAEGNLLELGSSTLRFEALSRLLRASPADLRLAFIDSCRSGLLVASKGTRRGPGFALAVQEADLTSGHAVITSSAADELSQESAEIRGSFFTHYLVSGLRGAADHSGDGQISLAETYRFAYGHTVAGTATSLGGSQHPMYELELAGRGEVVLTSLRGRSGVNVTVSRAARVLVLDQLGETMLAESAALPGRPAQLALAPGSYQIFLLEDGRAWRATLQLRAGQRARLATADFVPQRLQRSLAKGGLFKPRIGQQLAAGFLLRRMPLEGGQLSMGAAAEYGIELREGWLLLTRIGWSTAPDVGLSSDYHDLGLMAGVARLWGWPSPRARLRTSLLGGYEHLLQSPREGMDRHTASFTYLGGIGLDLTFDRLLVQLGGAVGGRVFRLREEGLAHRLDLQLVVAGGWRFGD